MLLRRWLGVAAAEALVLLLGVLPRRRVSRPSSCEAAPASFCVESSVDGWTQARGEAEAWKAWLLGSN